MDDILLGTKLRIPPLRREVVRRQRLMNRLGEGLVRKLTLVSAPAGFGKTTLLSEWTRELEEPVAWLSLDDGDNDCRRFLTYMTAALQAVAPRLKETVSPLLQAVQDPNTETVLVTMINELADCPHKCVLVLDDYHAIRSPEVHGVLGFVLEHQPASLHLVVATRADPPFNLARLRARGELLELRAADLSFSFEEAGALLNDTLALGAPEGAVRALAARTEGWVAGLHLAALSMRRRDDIDTFVSGFTGSHEYVVGYLAAEVLRQQPAEVREFLLQTSILERMTGRLCDAVTGRRDSRELLEQLAHHNAFVLPLDDDRRWYRYHGLLADVLHERLNHRSEAEIAELHRRACGWLEQNGYTHEAFRHALAAGDVELGVQIIKDRIYPLLLRTSPSTVSTYLDRLSEATIDSSPWLQVLHAWAKAYSGQYHEADRQLVLIEQELEEGVPGTSESAGTVNQAQSGDTTRVQLSEEERLALTGYAHTVRAHTVEALGHHELAARLAARALECLPRDDLTMRSLATTMSSVGDVAEGRPDRALDRLREAVDLGLQARDVNAAMVAACNMARVQLATARLHDAARTCRTALSQAGAHERETRERVPLIGYASTIYSTVLCQWGRLDEALQYAERGKALSLEWIGAQVAFRGYISLAQVQRARGELETALDTVDAAEQFVAQSRFSEEIYVDEGVAERLALSLAMGDLSTANRLGQVCRSVAGKTPNYDNRHRCLALARVLIAQEEPDEALELLDRLIEYGLRVRWTHGVLEARVLQSLAFDAAGKSELAAGALAQALDLGYPEGFITVFVEGGEPVARLLYTVGLGEDEALWPRSDAHGGNHASAGRYREYAGRILAAFPIHPKPVRPGAPELVEPLTQRELDVLGALAEGLTNQEAADKLFISLATVKTHTRGIYGKLGVNNRTQAVNVARRLGILPPLR